MKALTVHQPYASLIARGEKWVENRTWQTSHRGFLAIHAGKGSVYLQKDDLRAYPLGAMVAVVKLVACINLNSLKNQPFDQLIPNTNLMVADVVGHEYTEGPWCWILSRAVAMDPPIPCRGAQRLWECEFGFEAARTWLLHNDGRSQ